MRETWMQLGARSLAEGRNHVCNYSYAMSSFYKLKQGPFDPSQAWNAHNMLLPTKRYVNEVRVVLRY